MLFYSIVILSAIEKANFFNRKFGRTEKACLLLAFELLNYAANFSESVDALPSKKAVVTVSTKQTAISA